MAARAPGLVLVGSAWTMCLFPVDICHGFASLSFFKYPSYLELWCSPIQGWNQTVPVSLAAMVQSCDIEVGHKMHMWLQFGKSNTRKQAACRIIWWSQLSIWLWDKWLQRSDVLYLASTGHAMVSSSVAAADWLLWNNPQVLNLTLVLLDILWATCEPLLTTFQPKPAGVAS